MATLRMEVDKVELSNVIDPAHGEVFASINFTQSYTNPVVIAFVMTYAGAAPIDVRVRNVTSNGCEIFMQEWNNTEHSAEWISYAVIEAGSYTLPNGAKLEAGTVTIPSNAVHTSPECPGEFDTVTVLFDHTFVGAPSFFLTLNTYNNSDFISVSSIDVTTTEVKVFQERQRTSNVPANEVAGWFAIDVFSGDFPGGAIFETGHFQDGSSDGVDETPHKYSYTYLYTDPPIVFSQINTLHDNDGAWARGYSHDQEYFKVYAEEINDGGDRAHDDEIFSHLLFDKAFSVTYEEEFGALDSTNYRNICLLDPYVFRATSTGVNVYDLATESLVGYADFPSGATSVWANDDHLYMATSVSGVYRAPLSTVTGTLSFSPYKSYPDITANDVNYIHGSGDHLCVSTVSGIDRIKISSDEREWSVANNVGKCFQVNNGDYYYTINPFGIVTGLDGSLFDWDYGRGIQLSKPIEKDNYQLKLELPLTQPDDIFMQAARNGVDIRFIDNFGRVVPHYIEIWNHIDPPIVWVRLDKDVEYLYFIYGNEAAMNTSNGHDTFVLYDHFEDTTLDTDKWTFDNDDYSAHRYTIADSVITFRTTSNSHTVRLISNKAILGGIVEASVRYKTTQYVDDMDYVLQFNGGVHSYLGVSLESAHTLTSRTEQPVVLGTKHLQPFFNLHALTEWADYQASEYDGELLTCSGSLTNGVGYRVVQFSYNSNSNRPDLEIDWVRARVYDTDPPTIDVGRGSTPNNLFNSPELHAIYDSGSSYIYTAAKHNVINAGYISDIYVTEGTSSYNFGNTIFLGTSYGATVIEERRGDEENCYKRIYLVKS